MDVDVNTTIDTEAIVLLVLGLMVVAAFAVAIQRISKNPVR